MQSSVESTIKDMLDAMAIPYTKIDTIEIAGQVVYSIEAGEEGKALIGSHGDTVQAIDLLVKKVIEAKMPHKPAEEGESREPLFLVDVNGYRSQKIKDLQTKAQVMAERARSFQYDVELSPMSAYERLIVHTTLQGTPHVKTESQGEGRNRRVVIRYVSEI